MFVFYLTIRWITPDGKTRLKKLRHLLVQGAEARIASLTLNLEITKEMYLLHGTDIIISTTIDEGGTERIKREAEELSRFEGRMVEEGLCDQAVVVLRLAYQGMTQKEIAAKLYPITAQHVNIVVTRVRKTMNERYRKCNINLSYMADLVDFLKNPRPRQERPY